MKLSVLIKDMFKKQSIFFIIYPDKHSSKYRAEG